ncbi:MAG: hypothetical protein KAI66_04090, partial [Lentisphaeria bacterium]|nr:hypothetical protein [Lentisphaeria bacterium]
WYDGAIKRNVLSGGDWISHYHKTKSGSATYAFAANVSDAYTFWIRTNPLRSSLAYRLDGSDWTPVNTNSDVRGRTNIAADNKPDMRYIGWVNAGKVQLGKGNHTIEFRFDSKLLNHGAIDCFAFTRIPFAPTGTEKPSVEIASAAAPDAWFPVSSVEDEFSPDSVIDMSHLVEAPAGTHGFLKADGSHFRFADGTGPVKFWGIGAAPSGEKQSDFAYLAKWYRKHGIHLVRQHTILQITGLLRRDGSFDPARLDRLDRWFAALKSEGIYMTWSVFYPHHQPFLQGHDGYDPERFAELAKLRGNERAGNGPIRVGDFVNHDRFLQDLQLKYLKVLLAHRNPHTGLRYADDPALAVLEVQNESNVFWGAVNEMRNGKAPLFRKQVRRQFAQFVKRKYGGKDAAAKAWDGKWRPQDRWEAGELELMGNYHLGTDGPKYEFKGQRRRAGDFVEFLTSIQRGFFQRREREVRTLGFQGVTVTTAWKAMGPAASMANLHCDTSADAIDRHNYFGGGAGGHAIHEGKVSTATHLSRPGSGILNLALFQVGNRPFAVSEWSMTPPAPWKAEAAPLVAFYGLGLQGWDASYHFTCGGRRIADGWGGGKYVTATPHYLGQFPALAFAVRHGHVREGASIAARKLGKSKIFSGIDPLGQALSGGTHDYKELEGTMALPIEAVAAGRITVGFGKGKSQSNGLDACMDLQNKVVTANTGQLRWDYGNRIVEIRTPKTQAVIGFAGGRTIRLPAVTLRLKTPFVSLIFTPLDDKNLDRSKHILVTAMARDKQTGATFNADWSRLKAVGGPPLLMEPVQSTILLKGAPPTEIRACDIYGVPKGKPLPIADNGSFEIDGTHRAYYYSIRR